MQLLLLLFLYFIFNVPSNDLGRILARRALQQEQKGKFDDSEVNYKRALQQQSTLFQAVFNLANTLYRQERFEEAIFYYKQITNTRKVDLNIKAKAFHNMGTTYLRTGQLESSKLAFQAVLRLNSGDQDAKYNLAFVLKLIDKNKQEKPSETKTSNSDTSSEALDEKTSQNKKERNKEDIQSVNNIQQQEDIEQVLSSLDHSERSILDKVKRRYKNNSKAKVAKDW